MYDFVVIGSGPAGHKAAIQAAKAGAGVALVEKARELGGECVRRGTIPSKALRECAARLTEMKRQANAFELTLTPGREIKTLIGNVKQIVRSHVAYMTDQLARNGVQCFHAGAA